MSEGQFKLLVKTASSFLAGRVEDISKSGESLVSIRKHPETIRKNKVSKGGREGRKKGGEREGWREGLGEEGGREKGGKEKGSSSTGCHKEPFLPSQPSFP